ncbi:hypothetical protein GQ53DRAFT_746645 [Thozetella sp. PMI_491]|nr:hypothetical protein GQ53DRAFT_746645 [Thozetella sp. PMI_491]
MVRRNKCDNCRKLKIKCDEGLPRCSGCIHRCIACTRTYGKKSYKFVRVIWEPSDAAEGSIESRNVPEDTQEGVDNASIIGRDPTQRTFDFVLHQFQQRTRHHTPAHAEHMPVRPSPCMPYSRGTALVARWATMISSPYGDCNTDTFGNWSVLVPQYLGYSEPVNQAVQCFLDCNVAIANNTDRNIEAVWASNVRAVQSVQQSLVSTASTHVTADVLLAIQVLSLVKMLAQYTPDVRVVRVLGLSDLLKRHRSRLKASDSYDLAVNNGLAGSIFVIESGAAIMENRLHPLEDTEWRDAIPPPVWVPGVPSEALEHTIRVVFRSWTAVPRLARLIRYLRTHPEDTHIGQDATALARQIFDDEAIFIQATATGQLRYEMAMHPELLDAINLSYRFGSSRFASLVTSYWAVRLILCGLIDSLIEIVPFSALCINASAVYAEDIRIAMEALMATEYIFMGGESAAMDRPLFYTEGSRQFALLQLSFGAWWRLEKRARALGQEGSAADIQRARAMKKIIMGLINRILSTWQVCEIPEDRLLRLNSKFSART